MPQDDEFYCGNQYLKQMFISVKNPYMYLNTMAAIAIKMSGNELISKSCLR